MTLASSAQIQSSRTRIQSHGFPRSGLWWSISPPPQILSIAGTLSLQILIECDRIPAAICVDLLQEVQLDSRIYARIICTAEVAIDTGIPSTLVCSFSSLTNPSLASSNEVSRLVRTAGREFDCHITQHFPCLRRCSLSRSSNLHSFERGA